MSDEATTPAAVPVEAPLAEAPAEAAAPVEATEAPQLEAVADDVLEAIEGAPTDAGEPTVNLGGHDIPVSALSELPDDVLKQIKRTIRANGEDKEISLLDAIADAPKAAGFEKKVWELSQKRKELEQIAEGMGSDPVAAYAAIHQVTRGEAVERMAKQLMEELDYKALPADERAKADAQRELEQKAKRADEYERAEKERTAAAAAERARETLTPMMHSALDAAGLPRSEAHVGAMAETLASALKSGVITGTLTAADMQWAAQRVQERSSRLVNARFEGEGADLIARVGPENAAKIARAYAQSIRAQQPPAARPAGVKAKQPASSSGELTWEEYLEAANKRMGI